MNFSFPILTRPRLVQRLADAAQQRVTVLAAPAGFGKTVAIGQLLENLDEPWLRCDLERGGSGAGRAAKALGRGLSGRDPAEAAALASRLRPPEAADDGEDRAHALLAACAGFRGVFVLDGLTRAALREPDTCAFVRALVENAGPEIRWVLGVRSLRELPLATWLAYRIMEPPIATAELALDEDEARRLAATAGVGAEQADALHGWTQGWPTAFVLALRGDGGERTRAVVNDYLAEQVERELDPGEREVLSAVCAAPLLDLGLPALYAPYEANHVDDTLRGLAPLVEAVGDGLYRCQPLFRAYLSGRLRARDRAVYDGRMTAAAAALLAGGRETDALVTLTDAGALDAIEDLLRAHGAEIVERGDAGRVADALRALVQGGRAESPAVLSLRATLASYVGNFTAAAALSARAMAGAADEAERLGLAYRFALDLIKRNDPGAAELLKPLIAVLSGGVDRGRIAGPRRIEVLGTLALALTMLGDALMARRRIEEALEAAAASDDHCVRARIFHQASYIAYLDGDAQRAQRYAVVAGRLATEQQLFPLAARSYGIRYAIATGLEDEPERALEALEAMFACAKRSSDHYLQLEALAGSLDLYAERGDDAQVDLVLARIEALDVGVELQSTSVLPARALRAAWQGDFLAAYDLVARSAPEQPSALRRAVRWAEIAVYAAASNRREIALDAADNAVRAARSVDPATREERQRQARALSLSALALMVGGAVGSANGILRQAERARRELPLRARALLDAVRAVYLRLEVGSDGTPAALQALRGVHYGGLARLFEALPFDRGGASSSISQLTPAEVEVLRALARGGSSTKVAADLQRSVHTVNVHVKSILRKLSCASRHEALAIARDHGLIA